MEAAIGILGQLVVHVRKNVFDRWWQQRGAQQGLVYDPQKGVRQVPSQFGTMSATATNVTARYTTSLPNAPSVTINGDFLLIDLDWVRGDEIVLLLVFEKGYQSHGQTYLFEFDLVDGYAVELWPGDYSFYTLVLDPEASSVLDAEIIAVGYPDFDQDVDPNPISISGQGAFAMDMIVRDRLVYPDAPRFLHEL